MSDRSDRGATLVELSIIGLAMFTLLFGIFEFGMVFRTRQTVNDAVSAGAREGTIAGRKLGVNDETADYYVIKAIREDTSSIDPLDIDRIVVFKGRPAGAGDAASQVPAACKRGTPVAGWCNVYDANEAFLHVQSGDYAWFNCSTTPSSPACSWNPLTRVDGPNPSDIDYLGVWLQVDHPMATGLFGRTISISAASVGRLEPGVVE